MLEFVLEQISQVLRPLAEDSQTNYEHRLQVNLLYPEICWLHDLLNRSIYKMIQANLVELSFCVKLPELMNAARMVYRDREI